jgi:zinc transporter 2
MAIKTGETPAEDLESPNNRPLLMDSSTRDKSLVKNLNDTVGASTNKDKSVVTMSGASLMLTNSQDLRVSGDLTSYPDSKFFVSPRKSSLPDQAEDQQDMIIEEVDERDIESRVDSDASDKEQENLNVRAAIVHMVGDMVQSIGVIAAAVIIYLKPEWKIADPICTFLFSILVMFTTIPVFSDCMRILMESAPADMEVLDVFYALLELPYVNEIHDFHIWSLSDEKPIMTAHIVSNENPNYVLFHVTKLLQEKFNIHHSTIQIEAMKSSHLK